MMLIIEHLWPELALAVITVLVVLIIANVGDEA
jgi:hypothetical protein